MIRELLNLTSLQYHLDIESNLVTSITVFLHFSASNSGKNRKKMRVLIFKSYQCYESSKGSKAYRSYGSY